MRARYPHFWNLLILLTLGWTLGLCLVVLVAQPKPERTAADDGIRLSRISFSQLRSLVLERKEIAGHVIQSSDLMRVLEDAELLLRESSHARLILKACHIEGPRIMLKGPSRSAKQFPPDTARHLSKRKLDAALHIDLPIEIYKSTFATDLDLTEVVFQKRIIVSDTEFRKSASFQGVVFEQPAVFNHDRFSDDSDFSGVLFLKATTFESCEFKGQANFSSSDIRKDARLFITGEKLSVPLDFSESVVLGKLTLQGVERTFRLTDKVYLNRVNKNEESPSGELSLKNVQIDDSLYLDQGKWAKLDLGETQDGLHRPIRFGGFCDLRQGIFDLIDLRGVEFEGGADFSGAEIKTAIDFERTKLRKPVRVEWKQLAGKLHPVSAEQHLGERERGKLSRESYEELERNFQALGDLYGENESRYEKRREWDGRYLQWAISGYWVRPWRAVFSIVVLLVLASALNLLAFSGGWQHGWFWRMGPREALLDSARIPSAVQLALYAAALKPNIPDGYGARTPGRFIFKIEYGVFKAAEIVLIITISNTSPILRQFIPYFVPG